MADEIDIAADHVAAETEGRLIEIARKAAAIPAGAPGTCRQCAEESKRLVAGRCAPCRDGRL